MERTAWSLAVQVSEDGEVRALSRTNRLLIQRWGQKELCSHEACRGRDVCLCTHVCENIHVYACVCMCMFECMHVCLCACAYVPVCSCMYMCAYVSVQIYTHVFVCIMCIHVRAYICVCMYLCGPCMYTWLHTCSRVCMHLCMPCVHVHAYICMCMCANVSIVHLQRVHWS